MVSPQYKDLSRTMKVKVDRPFNVKFSKFQIVSKTKSYSMGTPASDKRKPISDTNTGLWIDPEPHHIEALTANYCMLL